MGSDSRQLFRIVPTEVEAAVIIARLDAEGVDAWSEGGIIGGFRAEAPGGISIFVHAEDHARAVEAMEKEPEPGAGTEGEADFEPATPPTTPEPTRRLHPLWMVLAIALAAWMLIWFLR